jgi:prepilin-type N-terminal cleavage/methylation domain-containing protein
MQDDSLPRFSVCSYCHHGFSIVELVITVAIILVIMALALPTTQVIRSASLRQAGSDYAGLLQNARIQAIQNDTYYAVIAQAGPPMQAFIDLQGTGTYASGDPLVVFPSSVHVRSYSNNPPGLGNLESQALASASDPSLDTTDNPTFGPRGLPCKPITSGSYTTCPAFSGTVSGTSFITFFQSEPDGSWEAVVLNPAARVRIYTYGSGSWIAAE